MDPELRHSDVRYEGPRLRLAVERWTTIDGEIERPCIHHPGAVAILALTAAAELVLVRQFRYPCRAWLWEIPAGTRVTDEDPLACARRELTEETGFAARDWTEECRLLPAPGISDEEMVLYRATGLTQGPSAPEQGELISVATRGRSAVQDLCRRGEIRDAKTLLALARLGWWPERSDGRP